MKVAAPDLRTTETDDRGRLHLGTEYANKRITVAVLEIEADRPTEEEHTTKYKNNHTEKYHDAGELARDIHRELAHVSDAFWASPGPAPRVVSYEEDG